METGLHLAAPMDAFRHPLCPLCGDQLRSWGDLCRSHERCAVVEVACDRCGHVHARARHLAGT